MAKGQAKSPEQHKFDGTYRADRHENTGFDSPQMTPGTPPPDWMTEGAKEIWRQLFPLLSDKQLIKASDYRAFIQLCVETDKYESLQVDLQNEGYTVSQTNKAGFTNDVPNPKVRIQKACWDNVYKLQSQFGLTPAARVKVRTEPIGSNTSNPEDEFI